MSAKTAAAFLAGALLASTGTAAALTQGHLFRLKKGDRASYGPVVCQAVYAKQLSALDCQGAYRWRVIYGPHDLRVIRLNKKNVYQTVFSANPQR
jgi:hypothetical protein